VLIVVFASLSDAFLTTTNLITMTRHVAINAVLALGMLLVVLKGGIDLSVGSIVGLSGVVAGELLGGTAIGIFGVVAYPPVWVVVLICIGVGTLVGLINGCSSRGCRSHRSSPRWECCTSPAAWPC
jgi:erythritol transport system permease protein